MNEKMIEQLGYYINKVTDKFYIITFFINNIPYDYKEQLDSYIREKFLKHGIDVVVNIVPKQTKIKPIVKEKKVIVQLTIIPIILLLLAGVAIGKYLL